MKRRTVGVFCFLLFKGPVSAAAVDDPASLDRLHDVITPAPVSWWPPALGWYVVASVGILLLCLAVVRGILRYRANAYRRAALVELNELAGRSDASALVAELLKRVALAAFPRTEVASLSGERWVGWLNETGRGDAFNDEAGRLLSSAAYRSPVSDESGALLEAARRWICRHRC
jgi:hypothetical protein